MPTFIVTVIGSWRIDRAAYIVVDAPNADEAKDLMAGECEKPHFTRHMTWRDYPGEYELSGADAIEAKPVDAQTPDSLRAIAERIPPGEWDELDDDAYHAFTDEAE